MPIEDRKTMSNTTNVIQNIILENREIYLQLIER